MTEPTTEELVRGALQGDAAAFGQIYDRFLPQVKRFLLLPAQSVGPLLVPAER